MAGIQTNNGKAFEYACLRSLHRILKETQSITIQDSPQLKTACNFFNLMSIEMKTELDDAANAAIRVIMRLEFPVQHNIFQK